MIAWLAGAALLVAAPPFLAEALRRPVRTARAPGAFADLPQGRTHYRWTGPSDGKTAVLIHGLSTPSFVFAATAQSLATLGYRVLSYDLYGRGYSARPGGAQDVDFFLAQLRALLADQKVQGPLTVVGYSMGGQIAAEFAAAEGDRVRAIVLIAPAGLVPVTSDGVGRAFALPVVGDWLTRVFGGWALRRELVEHKQMATVTPDLEDRQAAETRMRGYLPALLSSRRHVLSRTADAAQADIAKRGVPVLAIWGAEDPVIPLSAMGRLAELNPGARHVQVAGAGHSVLQTHPAQVAEALRDFLRPGPGGARPKRAAPRGSAGGSRR